MQRLRRVTLQFCPKQFLPLGIRPLIATVHPTYYGGNRGFARYPNLPPGHYTFEVLAANSDGVWSTAPKSLKIHIQTPFYKTWWFYLLCTIAVIALIYAWFRYRLQ